MGLLNYLTATSLDEDYAQAHAARARAAGAGTGADTGAGTGAGERPSNRPRTAALVVLALFGLLVATAAVQTSRSPSGAFTMASGIWPITWRGAAGSRWTPVGRRPWASSVPLAGGVVAGC